MTLSPKIFIPVVTLVIVGVIYYAENKPRKAPSEPAPRASRSKMPKRATELSGSKLESPSKKAESTPSSTAFENPAPSQEDISSSESIPVPDSEREAYEQIVKEAMQNSQPTKAFEAPTEKGQIWGNPYEDKLPGN